MTPGRSRRTPLQTIWHCCLILLVALSTLGATSQCGKQCDQGTKDYNGTCLSQTSIEYIECTKARGWDTSEAISGKVGAGTIGKVADASVEAAYEQSKHENTTVALEVVKDCLMLAQGTVTSVAEANEVRQSEQKVNQYIAAEGGPNPSSSRPAATTPHRVTTTPKPATTTANFADECLQDFVWREATPSDHVCVTPESRDQVRIENSLAAERRSPTGGDYGPDTCLEGFVWRGTTSRDHVCVEPYRRDEVATENQLAADRRVG